MLSPLQTKAAETDAEQPDKKTADDEEADDEEEVRPPMDLFKAIFADSSDEKSASSSEEESDPEAERETERPSGHAPVVSGAFLGSAPTPSPSAPTGTNETSRGTERGEGRRTSMASS